MPKTKVTGCYPTAYQPPHPQKHKMTWPLFDLIQIIIMRNGQDRRKKGEDELMQFFTYW